MYTVQLRLELPDKTIGIVPEEDHARGELNPAEIPSRRTVQPPRDPPKLRKKGMTTLHRTANPTNSRLPSPAALGRFHSKARCRRPLLAGAIAIGTIGPRVGQVTRVGLPNRDGRWRRLDNQRLQHGLSFDAVMDVGDAKDRPQRHPVGIAGYVDGCTRLTSIHRRRPGVLPPFLDGFFEPSRRT